MEALTRALSRMITRMPSLVGWPVIRRPNGLNVQEQSRVWWRPIVLFHFTQCVQSHQTCLRCVLSLLIFLGPDNPSYTPTFSVLIESRKPGLLASDKPSVLLVAQRDERTPEAGPHVESEPSRTDYQYSGDYSDFGKGNPNRHFQYRIIFRYCIVRKEVIADAALRGGQRCHQT
jgi:hypothetical protein